MSNVRLQQCNPVAGMGRQQERNSKSETKTEQTLEVVK
jgi:hypothetical protein